ncbi:hypothetical protein BDZ88DRAFT_442178 [Geranomyces variabilis]|nr:hypothetical protein BDZ88DRAFT_442178 [Geranomyces variabilis]
MAAGAALNTLSTLANLATRLANVARAKLFNDCFMVSLNVLASSLETATLVSQPVRKPGRPPDQSTTGRDASGCERCENHPLRSAGAHLINPRPGVMPADVSAATMRGGTLIIPSGVPRDVTPVEGRRKQIGRGSDDAQSGQKASEE